MHWVSTDLHLQIKDQGTRSWLFRYWVDSKPKVTGLGPVKDVPLAKARDKAERLRIEIRDGIDPAAEKKTARAQRKIERADAEVAKVPSFQACAQEYIDTHETPWTTTSTVPNGPRHRRCMSIPSSGRNR